MLDLADAHTFNLTCQGNIYTQAVLKLADGYTKLIVATLDRKVFCFDLLLSHFARPCGCVVKPQSEELQFTYIPSCAEIISLDAYNRSCTTNDFMIGITIIKREDRGSPGQYLNIYSDWSPDGSDPELDSLGHSCLSLKLDFIPYQLCHWEVKGDILWLLGGGDNKIHIFREDTLAHMYAELEPEEAPMPELALPLPSVPLFTSIIEDGNLRIMAIACECGRLQVTKVNIDTDELVHSCLLDFEGPLTSVHLFHERGCSDFIYDWNFPSGTMPGVDETKQSPPCLIVSHSMGQTLVYSLHSNNDRLDEYQALAGSDLNDIVTCLMTADLEQNGKMSILLGTFGQELLIYSRKSNEWELTCTKSFAAPILGIEYADLTGDGAKELIVITSRGVQVLQHDMARMKEITLSRLKYLSDAVISTTGSHTPAAE